MFPRQEFSKRSEASRTSITTSALDPPIISSAHLLSLFIHEGGDSLVLRCDSENVHWLSSELGINFSLQTMSRARFLCPSWCLTPSILPSGNWEEASDWLFQSQRLCTGKGDIGAWKVQKHLPSRPGYGWNSFILDGVSGWATVSALRQLFCCLFSISRIRGTSTVGAPLGIKKHFDLDYFESSSLVWGCLKI